MAIVRGIGLGLAVFVACFVLHIIGGATDQGWLFALAVVLIYLVAAGFPAVAAILSGAARGTWTWRATLVAGVIPGVFLTAAALWAANDRSIAWWHLPATPVLLAVTSFIVDYITRAVGIPRRTATSAA